MKWLANRNIVIQKLVASQQQDNMSMLPCPSIPEPTPASAPLQTSVSDAARLSEYFLPAAPLTPDISHLVLTE